MVASLSGNRAFSGSDASCGLTVEQLRQVAARAAQMEATARQQLQEVQREGYQAGGDYQEGDLLAAVLSVHG